jgi:thiamine-monophosphate kinase
VELEAGAIPVAPCAVDVAGRLGIDPLELALSSGEEFELIVTLPDGEVGRAIEHVKAVTGTSLTRVGEVCEEAAGCTLVDEGGSRTPLVRGGYEHLK